MSVRLGLALAYDTVLLAVCLFAIVRGGRPERAGSAINVAASVATIALRWSGIANGAPAEIVILAVDAAVLAGFFWLAVRTTRFWPVWAFGFAMADIVVSFAGALIPHAPLLPLHTGLGIYAYLALGALGLGTYRLGRNATPEQRQGRRSRWNPTNRI